MLHMLCYFYRLVLLNNAVKPFKHILILQPTFMALNIPISHGPALSCAYEALWRIWGLPYGNLLKLDWGATGHSEAH